MPRRPYVPSHRHSGAFVFVFPPNNDPPVAGHYRCRLVKGGPLVSARIAYGPTLDPETGEPLDRSWHYTVTVNGEDLSDPSPDFGEACGRMRDWSLTGERISAADYDLMVAQAAWDAAYAPDAPGANPRKPIDPMTTPLPF